MRNILWVEDEKASFDGFSYFASKDYNIDLATNYKEAVIKFSTSTHDALVVDLLIPNGENFKTDSEIFDVHQIFYGIEFIKHVRAKSKTIPVCVITVINNPDILNTITEIDSNILIMCKYNSGSKDAKNMIDLLFQKEEA